MSGNYVVYHLHSDYSLLDSVTDFSDYVQLAKDCGMTAIASTEHGKPMNWIEKKMACDKAGIKFMHGVEIYLTESLEEPFVRDNYHTILIAKNREGILELNRLVSISTHSDHTYYTNRISFDEFLGISDNIIKTSACLASPLNKLPDNHPRYLELAKHYDYLEIQPHLCEEQVEYNKRLYKLSQQIGVPLIAGTDTHNSSPYKAECREILTMAKEKYYPDDGMDLNWKSYDELVKAFAAQNALPQDVWMQAIENTNVLADSVEPFELDTSIKYPILYGSRDKDTAMMDKIVWDMLDDKLSRGVIPASQEAAFRAALTEEIRVFKKLKMEGFMLAMAELLGFCRKNHIATGPARGSVGGSRVAYVTDIIDLNPETWQTVFSRFCNEDRVEIGDIDVDVIDSDRPKIFKFIEDRFGIQYTARVASFGTVQTDASIDNIGKALRLMWEKQHPNELAGDNPWSLATIKEIKKLYKTDPEAASGRYPKLFYYLDGINGAKISQSVHPAGMVIAPMVLDDEYGVFDKDGERCLFLDMECVHEAGLAKFDFLVLKTVKVIKDTCDLIGIPYPLSHEIDWLDKDVWADALRTPAGLFQFEGAYAFESLKKFVPHSIEDMSLVTASIRPSGASYRDDLLTHKKHRNPSVLIDELLERNNGFLIYQEDIIAFLQNICGLSGSEADTVRRGIARKKPEILAEAMPKIMQGYCEKSDKPRETAEEEAKEFLQIIEDASSYMFGRNHSIAYCLVGYLCAYYRYYYPVEFITAFLNNAANDEDQQNGVLLMKAYGVKVLQPRYGMSRAQYFCDPKSRTISKGVASLKGFGDAVADEIYDVSQKYPKNTFSEVVSNLAAHSSVNSAQLHTLVTIDYFEEYGNQRELETFLYIYRDVFRDGDAVQIKKQAVAGTYLEPIIARHANGLTKSGKEAASWRDMDLMAILNECEQHIKSIGMQDYGLYTKVRNFKEAMGYCGYISGKEEDRPKLLVKSVIPLKRKKDGKQFGYSVITQSIGSGIETRFTVFNRVFNEHPIQEDDIIICNRWVREGQYFTMTAYRKVYSDNDPMAELEAESD